MRFEFVQFVELPIATLFAFHANPLNLSVLMAGWRPFRLLSHASDVLPGGVVWMEENVAMLPIVMAFEHKLVDPPYRIVDRLVHGPFRRFEHEHQFQSCKRGTIIRDLVDIEVSPYLGGEAMLRLLVVPRLHRMFAYRHAELGRLVSAGTMQLLLSEEVS